MLLLLTVVAVLIHGYHIGVEDQDVYLAAVNKSLDPGLYPVNSVFFTEQMKSSLFIEAVAGSIRLTGIAVPWALLLWQAGSIFLVLLGCWKVASACFRSEAARWSAVTLVTVLLTMPIAGTALMLVDTVSASARAGGGCDSVGASGLPGEALDPVGGVVAGGRSDASADGVVRHLADCLRRSGAVGMAAGPDGLGAGAAAARIVGPSLRGLAAGDAVPPLLFSVALDLV